MAIALTPSLIAHQAGTRRRPAVRVTASATRAGFPILRWERVSAEDPPAVPAAAVVTGAGSLVRVRNASGTLEAVRIAEPSSETAVFDGWASIGTATAGSPVALAANGSEVLLLSCSGSGKTVDVRRSTDDGVTWGAASGVLTTSNAVAALAVALSPAGDACLFVVETGSAGLLRLRRTSGTWASTATAWTRSALVDSLTGVAACHDGADFVLMVTGDDAATLDHCAWSVRMGDGGLPANAWSGLTVIASAAAASTVSFDAPSIVAADGDFHGFVTRNESGHVPAAATLSTHPLHFAGSASPWTEPVPFRDAAAGAFVAAGVSSAMAWAASSSEVWRAPLAEDVAAGDALLACTWDMTFDSARARFEFDTALVDTAGAGLLLVPGNTLAVEHGYASGSGGTTETGLSLAFTIERADRGGDGRVIIEASGAWEELARWHAPDSWQAPAGLARDGIAGRLAAWAGVPLSVASGDAAPPAEWGDTPVAFALTPGERGSSALQRLMVGLGVAAVPSGGGLALRGFDVDEAALWDLGGTGEHPIATCEADAARDGGWVRLQGDGRYADAFDATVTAAAGVVRDSSADTDAMATAHAATVFRERANSVARARLTLPFHAGIELGDVVAVTAAGAEFEAVKLRVTALGMRYARGPRGARYDTVLTLGGV